MNLARLPKSRPTYTPSELGSDLASPSCWVSPSTLSPFSVQGDAKMMEILRYTHQFLQKFCAGNPGNQALLHKHLHLFLTPGVRARGWGTWVGWGLDPLF